MCCTHQRAIQSCKLSAAAPATRSNWGEHGQRLQNWPAALRSHTRITVHRKFYFWKTESRDILNTNKPTTFS